MDMRLDLDPSSFFDEFYPKVFRFVASATGASAADVDDLVQETLLHAWRNRAQFQGNATLITWILAIARNRTRMRLRALKKRPDLQERLRAIDHEEVPDDVVRSDDAARAVRRALDSLGDLHSQVLIKRYFDGLTVRQIAEALRESEKAVESRLHRARQALRERLLQGGDHEF